MRSRVEKNGIPRCVFHTIHFVHKECVPVSSWWANKLLYLNSIRMLKTWMHFATFFPHSMSNLLRRREYHGTDFRTSKHKIWRIIIYISSIYLFIESILYTDMNSIPFICLIFLLKWLRRTLFSDSLMYERCDSNSNKFIEPSGRDVFLYIYFSYSKIAISDCNLEMCGHIIYFTQKNK